LGVNTEPPPEPPLALVPALPEGLSETVLPSSSLQPNAAHKRPNDSAEKTTDFLDMIPHFTV
jgi:hypothetical protein